MIIMIIKEGISKCGIMNMKSGKYQHSQGIKLPNNKEITEIDQTQGCKHLGALEIDG